MSRTRKLLDLLTLWVFYWVFEGAVAVLRRARAGAEAAGAQRN